jgi:hypothetical protein
MMTSRTSEALASASGIRQASTTAALIDEASRENLEALYVKQLTLRPSVDYGWPRISS